MPGVVNGGFNSKKKSWQKAKKQRAREVKKRKGAAAKHKAGVTSVSGKRTKKHQRRADKASRLQGKEAEALESAMQVEGEAATAAVVKKPAARKLPAKKKKGGAKGKGKAAPAAAAAPAAGSDAMQE